MKVKALNRVLLLVTKWIGESALIWVSGFRQPLLRALMLSERRCGMLRDELDLVGARLRRIDPRTRPHYRPPERLGILRHRERHGLSIDETARRFVLSVQTIANWLREVKDGIVRRVMSREPLNKLPDLVREIAHELKFRESHWGTRRLAGILARMGLKASRTSVQRILRKPRPRRAERAKRVKAGCGRGPIRPKAPMHVVYADFTKVCAFFGMFKLTIGALVDGFSRKVLAVMAWRDEPTARDARELMRRAIQATGGPPRWLVTDRGTQFRAKLFKRWLRRRGVRWRHGAVASKQSTAVVERFWLSLKTELVDRFFTLKPLSRANRDLQNYASWFNQWRGHWGLRSRTPSDVFTGRSPRRHRRLRAGEELVLAVRHVGGLPSLPAYFLQRRAA